jgi:glycosyltransferase involved in cell wall biosynthesis
LSIASEATVQPRKRRRVGFAATSADRRREQIEASSVMAATPEPDDPPRVLILSPFPPRLEGAHGGTRVIAQFVVRFGHRARIAILCLRPPSEPHADDGVRDVAELVEEVALPEFASLGPRALRFLRWRARLLSGRPIWVSDAHQPTYGERLEDLVQTFRPHVVQIEYAAMAQYLPALARSPAVRVLVEHDPEIGMVRRSGLVPRRLEARASRRFRQRVLRAVDAAVAFTERDRAALEPLAGPTPVVRIPFGTDFADRRFARAESDGSVLFVGYFVHPPNADAARRLVTSIFPRVRRAYPGCVLYVVGDRPPKDLVANAPPGVVITGYVPDVAPYVERAAVVAIPLRQGRGMRVKVLEALAAGRAVVASPLAVGGLDVADGEQLLLATTNDEFVARIAELLADDGARRALAERARAWAEQNLTWRASIEAYERLYAELLANRPA